VQLATTNRPFARVDHAGLLWLLDGDRFTALSENTASIETRTGASDLLPSNVPYQTYHLTRSATGETAVRCAECAYTESEHLTPETASSDDSHTQDFVVEHLVII
jgi:hypothetical protein